MMVLQKLLIIYGKLILAEMNYILYLVFSM